MRDGISIPHPDRTIREPTQALVVRPHRRIDLGQAGNGAILASCEITEFLIIGF